MKKDLENIHKSLQYIQDTMPWYMDKFIDDIDPRRAAFGQYLLDNISVKDCNVHILNSGLSFWLTRQLLAAGASDVALYDKNPFIRQLNYNLNSSNRFEHTVADTTFQRDKFKNSSVRLWVNLSCHRSVPMADPRSPDGSIVKNGIPNSWKFLAGHDKPTLGNINRISSCQQLADQWQLSNIDYETKIMGKWVIIGR